MIIDSHQHVFWHGRDDAGLIGDMDACGIDQAWLLSWEIAPAEDAPQYHGLLNPLNLRPDGTHAGIVLADLIKARDRYPDRLVLGYCPHPLLGDAPGLLKAAHAIHGARVCGEFKFRVLINDPRCLNLFRMAGALGMPVVLHLDLPFACSNEGPVYNRDWYGGTIDDLRRALDACPKTQFIGHAPGFWREISGNAAQDPSHYPDGPITPGGGLMALLDACPNLHADLSAGSGLNALKRDPAHAKGFLQRYHDRLLFGRDEYGNRHLDFLETLELAPEHWQAIAAGNARRLLGQG